MADKEKKDNASEGKDKKTEKKSEKKEEDKSENEEENSEVEAGQKKIGIFDKKILIIAIAVGVLLLGGGVAAFFMMGDDEPVVADEATSATEQGNGESSTSAGGKDKALYIDISPEFVININDGSGQTSFLQVGISIMARDEKVIDAIKEHDVLIKNNLVNIFIDRNYHELITVEGKESLRAEALEEVRQILKEQSGITGVEAIYFTSFVLQ